MRTPEVSREAHRLQLGSEGIEYIVVRRRGRRGVRLSVDARGLTLSAPVTLPHSQIEAFLRENGPWVVRNVAKWRTRRVAPQSWNDGAAIPYLGDALVLRHEFSMRPRVELDGGVLRVGLARHGDEAVQAAVTRWYRGAAHAHFNARSFALARESGIEPPRVFVSSARTRWGSCNRAREVRLAWRLLKARAELVDYVICHELAHLAHMDHSQAFWAEVGRLCPEHRRLRVELRATDHLYRTF